MKTTKLKVPVLVILILLGFAACNKDDDQPNDALADVYVKSVLMDGEPVFGLVHIVAGYSAMDEVLVSGPGAYVEQLNALDNSKLNYYLEPSTLLGSYSSDLPAEGIYSYTVTFDDGEEKTVTNTLSDDYLLPADITSITKSVNNEITLTWGPMPGVDYYQLSIRRGDNLVYSSQLFKLNTTENTIDVPASVIPNFTSGTYTFILDAVDYEDFNKRTIQALSTASADIAL